MEVVAVEEKKNARVGMDRVRITKAKARTKEERNAEKDTLVGQTEVKNSSSYSAVTAEDGITMSQTATGGQQTERTASMVTRWRGVNNGI